MLVCVFLTTQLIRSFPNYALVVKSNSQEQQHQIESRLGAKSDIETLQLRTKSCSQPIICVHSTVIREWFLFREQWGRCQQQTLTETFNEHKRVCTKQEVREWNKSARRIKSIANVGFIVSV
jgi:hypothetical protein